MKPKLYVIPGMGTTSEAFKYLELPELEVVPIEFVEPNAGESLHDYAMRMAAVIPKDEKPILLGLSMGGFIAQEIASARSVEKVILLSSMGSGEAWQPALRLARKSRAVSWIPKRVLKTIMLNAIKHLGIPKQWKNDLLEMTMKFSPHYFQFAGDRLLNWRGVELSCPVIRIHGTKDEVFPINNTKQGYVLKGGSHFMVGTHAKKVSELILEAISV